MQFLVNREKSFSVSVQKFYNLQYYYIYKFMATEKKVRQLIFFVSILFLLFWIRNGKNRIWEWDPG
jgi:hypothetical protein